MAQNGNLADFKFTKESSEQASKLIIEKLRELKDVDEEYFETIDRIVIIHFERNTLADAPRDLTEFIEEESLAILSTWLTNDFVNILKRGATQQSVSAPVNKQPEPVKPAATPVQAPVQPPKPSYVAPETKPNPPLVKVPEHINTQSMLTEAIPEEPQNSAPQAKTQNGEKSEPAQAQPEKLQAQPLGKREVDEKDNRNNSARPQRRNDQGIQPAPPRHEKPNRGRDNNSRDNHNGRDRNDRRPNPGSSQGDKPSILDRVKLKNSDDNSRDHYNRDNRDDRNRSNQPRERRQDDWQKNGGDNRKESRAERAAREAVNQGRRPNEPREPQPNGDGAEDPEKQGQGREDPEKQQRMEQLIAKAPKKKKCVYFPNCKNPSCEYIHPEEDCPYFPKCMHGENCFFKHPNIPCKFGLHCQRENCAYSHPTKLKLAYAGYAQPQGYFAGGRPQHFNAASRPGA